MKTLARIAFVSIAGALASCGQDDAQGPPTVRLGDSLCAQCNMIISNERWATATIIDGPRGGEPRLFDDFNCQVNFEAARPDLVVLARWSHDYRGSGWLRTEEARFLMSPALRTPMGSQVAAFASPAEAQVARSDLTGDLMDFKTCWARLGFAGACHESDPSNPSEEHHHGP